MLGRITGKMISPKKAQEKLKDYNYKVGRAALIKGLPSCIKQGYKEQKEKGISPTVNSLFDAIELDNLDFYHKMDISSDYIKEVIRKVLISIDKSA
jgi:hypothetical protein